MRFRCFAFLAACALTLLSSTARADSYTYAVATSYPQFQVSGTITTDTNYGVLEINDITDLNLTLTAGTNSDTLTFANADDIELYSYGLQVSPDALYFDFDIEQAVFLIKNSSAGTYLCFQMTGCDDNGSSHESIQIAGGPVLVQDQMGAMQIGTIVPDAVTPEPSSLLLMGTGAVSCFLAMRRRAA